MFLVSVGFNVLVVTSPFQALPLAPALFQAFVIVAVILSMLFILYFTSSFFFLLSTIATVHVIVSSEYPAFELVTFIYTKPFLLASLKTIEGSITSSVLSTVIVPFMLVPSKSFISSSL